MNDNPYTNDIIICHFIRMIKRKMNWCKQLVGLNPKEANTVNNLYTFQKNCVSWLDYIAKSMQEINAFIVSHAK